MQNSSYATEECGKLLIIIDCRTWYDIPQSTCVGPIFLLIWKPYSCNCLNINECNRKCR